MLQICTAVLPADTGVSMNDAVPLDVVNPDTDTIPPGLGDGDAKMPVKFDSETATDVGLAVALAKVTLGGVKLMAPGVGDGS